MQKERKQAAGQRALLAGTETITDKEMNGTIRQREIRQDDMAERAPLKQRFLTGEKEHACLLVALWARADRPQSVKSGVRTAERDGRDDRKMQG